MATIKILGDSYTVVSVLKVEEIKTLAKYDPKALKLYGGEDKKDQIFAVDMNTKGGINQFGATFTGANAEGFAYLTQTIASTAKTADEKKAAVLEATGFAMLSLNKIEKQAAAALKSVNGDIKTVNDSMTVVD
jgi:hypothetical protein